MKKKIQPVHFKMAIASSQEQKLSVIQILPPYMIGSVAMFWVIERITAF